jgi:hypothetical protein
MPLYTGQEFTKIFNWDGGGLTAPHYTDVTLEAQSPLGTSFTILNSATHYLYLGHDERFDMAIFDVDVPAAMGALTWEYYNGSTWIEFIPASGRLVHDPDVPDYGTPYGFTKDGVEIFPANLLMEWATIAVNSVTKYWVRVTAASVEAGPTIKRIQMRPMSAYCSTKDVFNLLQLQNITDTTDFTTTTVPSKLSVEQFIEAAQSKIEYATRKSWRPQYIAEEYHDFNLNGFRLRRNDAYKLISLDIWDGAGWETKREGRSKDFFLTPDVGIVYFSRYFLLPARFQSYNAPVWRFGGGEFTNPIRVTYLAGRDIHTNPFEAGVIYDTAKKIAAIEVMRSSDFGQLTVSGADRVNMLQKIEGWEKEIEDRVDQMRSWEIF